MKSSDGGVAIIVDTLYKRDPLSVVATVYGESQMLLIICRHCSESCRDYEMRFAV